MVVVASEAGIRGRILRPAQHNLPTAQALCLAPAARNIYWGWEGRGHGLWGHAVPWAGRPFPYVTGHLVLAPWVCLPISLPFTPVHPKPPTPLCSSSLPLAVLRQLGCSRTTLHSTPHSREDQQAPGTELGTKAQSQGPTGLQ